MIMIMKKIKFCLIITALSVLAVYNLAEAQAMDEILAFQAEWNTMFADTARSPLPDKDVAHFKGLDFFPIDLDYRVEATFTLTPDAEIFMMPTSTERIVAYRKYGEATFKLHGETYTLALYQNQKYKDHPTYGKELFLPYKDFTNGVETYGGGRYIDVKIPEGDHVIIDFNQSYNPYCAYNGRYSCPIPPDENHMQVEIRAGVMAYSEH